MLGVPLAQWHVVEHGDDFASSFGEVIVKRTWL